MSPKLKRDKQRRFSKNSRKDALALSDGFDLTMDIFEQLKKIRRGIVALTAAATGIFAIGCVAMVLLSVKSATASLTVLLISFVLTASLFVIVGIEVGKFRGLYKHNLVRELLGEVFDELEYVPEKGISKETVEATATVMMGNTYSSSDYISGKYKDTSFRRSDVAIQNIASVGKNKTTLTFFSGRWMIFDFKRDFKYDLQVKEKTFSNAQTTGYIFSNKPKLERVTLDNNEFNYIFKAYAVSEDEAHGFMSDEFCRSLLELNRRVKGDFMFAFSDNHLHIAYHGAKKVFEPELFAPLNHDEIKSQILYDTLEIISFVDFLRENDSFFK